MFARPTSRSFYVLASSLRGTGLTIAAESRRATDVSTNSQTILSRFCYTWRETGAWSGITDFSFGPTRLRIRPLRYAHSQPSTAVSFGARVTATGSILQCYA